MGLTGAELRTVLDQIGNTQCTASACTEIDPKTLEAKGPTPRGIQSKVAMGINPHGVEVPKFGDDAFGVGDSSPDKVDPGMTFS